MTSLDDFATEVLNLYLHLPETPIRTTPNDRKSAIELYKRGINLPTIESALLLGSLRRLARSPEMPPLSPIRSLAYFVPVIQELLDNPVPDSYVLYLRTKLHSLQGNAAAATTLR
jgi:hypothetical protein